MKYRSFLLSLLVALPLLSGCNGFKTPETDALKLTASFENQIFTEPSDGVRAIGEVTLTGVTDGDTMNFLNGRVENPHQVSEASFTCRLIGVNTPESTAQVQPWGVKASAFVKNILWDEANNCQKVYSVVMQNDYDSFEITDNTSSERYLCFLWYQAKAGDDYRLLNLELIENCYSVNNLGTFSLFCPYLEAFNRAGLVASNSGRRVNGEMDPDYDYTNKILEVTIDELRENYSNYGVTEEEGGSGVRLHVIGVVIGMIGHNFILRDLVDPDEDGIYESIYLYVGFGKDYRNRYHIGDVVQVYCRATTYSNNIQLTDLQDDIFLGRGITRHINVENYGIENKEDWNDETKVLAIENALKEINSEYVYNIAPYLYTDGTIDSSDKLNRLVGQYVQIDVVVRAADANDEAPSNSEEGQNYYRIADDGDYTVYGKLANSDVKLNIRSIFESTNSKNVGFFRIGVTYRVTAYLSKYYNTYQLQLFNNGVDEPYFDSTRYEWDGSTYIRGYVYPLLAN